MITFTDTLKSITDEQPPLTIPVGVTGDDILKALDLAKAPHILYAGATGSGKSVGLNAAIVTLMKRNDPTNLRFTMIDPKRVELSNYRRSAFVDAVITDMDEANEALEGVVKEMERRYRLLEDAGVKNIASYNEEADQPLAYHVLVVDELADLMDTHSATVFPALVRLGQLARAAGIHMMLATQRPAADTTPKKLVSNIPTRIGFMTQSDTESRIILGKKGAEDLKGNGDLLAQLPGSKGLVRAQGPFVSEDEIDEIVNEHQLTDTKPEVTEEAVAEAEEALASTVTPTAAPATAAPASDTAAIVGQVVSQLTEQLEASAQAKVNAAEADRDEAKRKRDEMAEELSAMQVKLETVSAEADARVRDLKRDHRAEVSAERAEAAGQLRALRDVDDRRVAAADERVRRAQRAGRQIVPFLLIAGAIATLLVAGLTAAGLTGLAIVAPFAVGTVAAIIMADTSVPETARTHEETMERKRDGQHLRSGSTEPGGRNARRHAAEGRSASR